MKRLITILLTLVLLLSVMPSSGIQVSAASPSYWIKVNKQCNVATVYQQKSGKWTPIKAMLTSCGSKGNTPLGTFKISDMYTWCSMRGSGASYAQYATRITGHIMFHSVCFYNYGNKKTQDVKAFNKLGSNASLGCVRLCTADAKWIYNNCKKGTKVTIYKSSNPGPLGKPDAYKMPASAGNKNWDPTDANPNNPYYQSLPQLSQKVTNVTQDDQRYASAKSLVTASQKNKKPIKKLTVVSVKKWSYTEKKWLAESYSVNKTGVYLITYTLTGSAGVSITKTFKIRVSAQ